MTIPLGPHKENNSNKFSKKHIIIIILVFFIILGFFINFLYNKKVFIEKNIRIEKGDTLNSVYKNLSFVDRLSFDTYLKFGKPKLNIKPGFYNLSGSLEKQKVINRLNKGPKRTYENITILEGWNKYDIDYNLSQDNLIGKEEYINFVDSGSIIKSYIDKYEFLKHVSKNNTLKSLEGFLYPDTHKIDISKSNYVDQLVYLQLESFKNRVWSKYKNKIKDFKFLNFYEILNLASIVEREERLDRNKSLVAGILINRLKKGMKIGADITVCYGLEKPFYKCKNTLTSFNLSDNSNSYNTRANKGLPPTPIGNPTISSIKAVLNYKKTDYLYYLHDKNGNIHPSKNIQQHNFKKSKYINN